MSDYNDILQSINQPATRQARQGVAVEGRTSTLQFRQHTSAAGGTPPARSAAPVAGGSGVVSSAYSTAIRQQGQDIAALAEAIRQMKVDLSDTVEKINEDRGYFDDLAKRVADLEEASRVAVLTSPRRMSASAGPSPRGSPSII
eukprot:1182595-Prorocentrum_minimum.AAC.1